MIDAAKSGEKGTPLKLKAQEVFGDGRHGYWDYDIFAVMKTVFASFPDGQPGAAEMKQAVQLMPSTSSPIVVAITFGPARALVQIQTPISLFRTVAGMAQSIMPQPQLQPPQPPQPQLPLEGAADGK